MPDEKHVGKITHFFPNISVAVVNISDGVLKPGDFIHIKGATTDFTQKIDSMQMEHKQVTSAKKGNSVGLKVKDSVHEHDLVYKVS